MMKTNPGTSPYIAVQDPVVGVVDDAVVALTFCCQWKIQPMMVVLSLYSLLKPPMMSYQMRTIAMVQMFASVVSHDNQAYLISQRHVESGHFQHSLCLVKFCRLKALMGFLLLILPWLFFLVSSL